ncbi:MAG: YHS domain-containing protein [Paracoccaceae bacterium]|jgi:YHS domain-containing protein
MNIKNTLAILLTLANIFVASNSFAKADVEVDANAVILSGHDAVAYFSESKAVQGSRKFTATLNGAIYHFSSAKNRDVFKLNPSKYAPQYGGFCAYGASLGKKFDIDGKAFEVVDGKLYVNKNLNVYKTWAEEKVENIAEADSQWATIKDIPKNDL